MNRRDLIVGAGAGLGAVWHGSRMLNPNIWMSLPWSQKATVSNTTIGDQGKATPEHSPLPECTYHVLGVPFRTGSLYPGNENDAQAYRDVQLLARMHAAGCKAIDDGDVAIPSYLPHHSIPPIRSWPGPRIAWDCVSERILPFLRQPGHVPLLIGCDCSVVVGTTQALMSVSGENVHVLYIDGDFDDAAPDAEHCQSAASLAVWLVTHGSPFWTGPPLRPSQVTVIGWSSPSRSHQPGMGSFPLADVRRSGPREAARRALEAIPDSASILLHFDVDVFQKQEMPAAYFPHPEGLTLFEGAELLGILLKDPRVRIIEVSEYATLRDLDQRWVNKLVDLLAEGLRR
jgi:arginase